MQYSNFIYYINRALILYNYKIKINENNINDIHEETANQLYTTCYKNDGLYVKFG